MTMTREQLAELERDRQQGELSESEYTHARDELSRRLLEDADRAADTGNRLSSRERAAADTTAPSRSRRWLALGLALYLPLAGLGLYGWLGQPLGLDPVALSQGQPDHTVDPSKLTEMVAKLGAQGLELRNMKPDELVAFNRAEIGKWAELVRRSGAQVD